MNIITPSSMRKALLFLLLCIPSICFGQKVTISMENDGGVYKVPCEVNGAKMKFIFDTGATVVSLSSNMADYLLENGYLSKYDFEGTGEFVDANGHVSTKFMVNIKDLVVAGLHIKNVKASISDKQNVPLLLGLSAIQKLGKVTIEGIILTINTGDEVDEYNPTSFLGVPFGEKRSLTRRFLHDKYGSDFYQRDDHYWDCVENVYISSVKFDYAFFYYDRNNNLVSGYLSKEYDKKDIKKTFTDRDNLAKKYKIKYPDIEKRIDDNNNYYYVCGDLFFCGWRCLLVNSFRYL